MFNLVKVMKVRIIVLSIVFSLASCNKYLDIIPDNIPTLDDAFADRVSSERYLATCYYYLKPQTVVDDPGLMGADDVWFNVNDKFSTQRALDLARFGNEVSNPLWNFWEGRGGVSSIWKGIRTCNTFLDNIHKARDLDSFERARWIAEVKTLKAWYYFYLMRLYGPIPILDKNIPINADPEDVKVYREPIDELVKYIVSLLDQAIPDLPLTIENGITEGGRITKPAAATIKALVLVTGASPLFNGNTDYASFQDERGIPFFNQQNSQKKWEDAAKAAGEAIEICNDANIKLYEFSSSFNLSDQTKLVLTPGQVVTNRFNSERIWSLSDYPSLTIQLYTAPRLNMDQRGQIWQRLSPTLKMAELFYTENGVPIEEDINFDFAGRYHVVSVPSSHKLVMQEEYPTVKLHLNRENRFYGSLAIDGGLWFGFGRNDEKNQWPMSFYLGSPSGGRIGLERYSSTGYYIKKLSHYLSSYTGTDLATTMVPVKFDFPLIRLADLYLLYAEALNESLVTPNGDVYHYVDLVRRRAGLEGVVQSWNKSSKSPNKPASKEGMREIIHQERNIELAFEGHRFYDLRRWKKAIQYFNQPIQGWNIEGENATNFYHVLNHERRYYTLKDVFYPISQGELLRNNKLVQNPGW